MLDGTYQSNTPVVNISIWGGLPYYRPLQNGGFGTLYNSGKRTHTQTIIGSMTVTVIDGTNYTANEKEKHCCWKVGLDQFSAAPLTGMLKPTQTVTVYWITCHTIKEPPFYRCGHPLQAAQSVIEMHHIQDHHSPVVDHRTSQAESTKPVW